MGFWEKLWSDIVSFFTDNVWQIVAFFVVAILGLVVIKVIMIILKKVFKRTKLDHTLANFLTGIIKFVLLLVYLMTLLSIMGIPITTLVAIVTALSLAVGLAVQNALSSLAYGIILIAGKIYREGDYVEIDGVGGTVQKVSMVNTILRTPSGQIISIPNSKTAASTIVNYSKDGFRRLDITVPVPYNSDIETVKGVLLPLLGDERVVENPENGVMLKEFSASALDFNLRTWTKVEDYWSLNFDLRERIIAALRENGLQIPYQTIDLNIKDNDKTPSLEK